MEGRDWGLAIMSLAQAVAAVEQSAQQRQRARVAGWLMASTFLTSIPAALILYHPVLHDAGYILGAGDDTRVTLGALLEMFLMVVNSRHGGGDVSVPQAIQRNPFA
jgi:hypothetical protein